MKKSSVIFLLTAAGAAVFTYFLFRRSADKNRLAEISDEGYETATDILFPGKKVGSKLHYGPVIPANE